MWHMYQKCPPLGFEKWAPLWSNSHGRHRDLPTYANLNAFLKNKDSIKWKNLFKNKLGNYLSQGQGKIFKDFALNNSRIYLTQYYFLKGKYVACSLFNFELTQDFFVEYLTSHIWKWMYTMGLSTYSMK